MSTWKIMEVSHNFLGILTHLHYLLSTPTSKLLEDNGDAQKMN